MKQKIPFNAGDLVQTFHGVKFMIVGHVWWPVEKKNAYYCLPVNEYGEPTTDTVEYRWDHGDDWKLYHPKKAA